MKDIKKYIIESTQDEDLYDEVALALKPFGNIKNGFKYTKKEDIEDAMYKLGFDFDDENSNEDYLMFVGDYIDSKYEIEMYIEDEVSGKVKIRHFNVFEI